LVRAHGARRDQYRPLKSPLSPTSDPADVMRGLYSVYPFRTFYVADLDAIMGTGNNEAAQRRLKAEFPAAGVSGWIIGVSDLSSARSWLDAGLGHLVIGSESQHDMALMRPCQNMTASFCRSIFAIRRFWGLPRSSTTWRPGRGGLIVMTLARVGSAPG